MMATKRNKTPIAPLAIVGLAIAIACAMGCSSGGGVIDPGVSASFVDSGTASGANMARLTGAAAGDTVTVRLAIGGPTTSTDLYAFAFDLVLGDDTVAEYVAGSATFGSALTLSGGQTSQVLATQNGDRITVGVTKLGGGTGNGVGAGESVVVELDFRLLTAGSTALGIEGSVPNDPAALDSGGSEIGTVVFDGGSATLVGA